MNLQFDVTDIEILIGELECLSMSLTAITNRMEIILEKAKHHLKFSKQNTPESKEYRRMLRMYEPFLQELALAEVRASLNEQKKSCL